MRMMGKDGTSEYFLVAGQVDTETWPVDSQTGSIDCSSHLDGAQAGYTRLLRIDDAELSPLIGKAVQNRRAR